MSLLRAIVILPMMVAPIVIGLLWRHRRHPTVGIFTMSLGFGAGAGGGGAPAWPRTRSRRTGGPDPRHAGNPRRARSASACDVPAEAREGGLRRERARRRQNALKVIVVTVRSTPGMSCRFSAMKRPTSASRSR